MRALLSEIKAPVKGVIDDGTLESGLWNEVLRSMNSLKDNQSTSQAAIDKVIQTFGLTRSRFTGKAVVFD